MMAQPVPEDRLEQHFREVPSMQAAQAVLWRKRARDVGWGRAILAVICVGQTVALVSLLPMVRYVPVFVYTNDIGMMETASAISVLPPDVKVAGIEATLWQYVRRREHYSAVDAKESYDIVSAMSTAAVRTQYQGTVNPKLNPKAPAKELGEGGFIRMFRASGAFVAHNEDYSSGRYVMRVCRVVHKPGQGTAAHRMTVTLSYELVTAIPVAERFSDNPIGLIVTEYPGLEPEGKSGWTIAAVGSDNPCV